MNQSVDRSKYVRGSVVLKKCWHRWPHVRKHSYSVDTLHIFVHDPAWLLYLSQKNVLHIEICP